MPNMKPLICSRIHGEHHDAVEFNQRLEKMCDQRVAIVAKLKAEAEFIYKSLKKRYTFEAKDCSAEPFIPAAVKADCVRLVKRWDNKNVYDNVLRLYGVGCGDEISEVACSVVYYYQNGLLLQVVGTGKMVLKPNQPITQQEWEELKRGNVPLKFAA